jgi:methionine synthase II (cobalamin-independent)
VRFGELGYAREARASYLDFCAARERGDLPAGVRFQVCLPTPLAVIGGFCMGKEFAAIERAYENAMLREVETLCRAIPHRDLCLQWDVCFEMMIWDAQPQTFFPPTKVTKDEALERFRRLCAPIPPDVELGFHLCYGDFGAKHYIEPVDAGKLVELSNALAREVKHPLAYIHMPVPLARSDEAYFKPLRDLKLAPQSKLYLGLVHAADGAEGTRKRIAMASKYAAGFGVATECGMARARTPELVERLLAIHAEVSREPTKA